MEFQSQAYFAKVIKVQFRRLCPKMINKGETNVHPAAGQVAIELYKSYLQLRPRHSFP